QVSLTAQLAVARNEQAAYAGQLRQVADMYASAGTQAKERFEPTLRSMAEGTVNATTRANELQRALAAMVPRTAAQQLSELSNSLIAFGRGMREIGIGLSAAVTAPLVAAAAESL